MQVLSDISDFRWSDRRRIESSSSISDVGFEEMTHQLLRFNVGVVLFATLTVGHVMAADTAVQGNRRIQSISPVKSSIQRDGDNASMIVLFTYRRMQSGYFGSADRPKTYYYNSIRSLIEFDCREHRSRIVRTVFFSDRNARGNLVHQQEATGGWIHDDDFAQKDSLSFIACQSPLNAP